MITIVITLKLIISILSILGIYISINLYTIIIINMILRSRTRAKNIEFDGYINVDTNILKYIFTGFLLLFNYKKRINDIIYQCNCKRLKMLTDLSFIYVEEKYNLERKNLSKDIYKYELNIKLKRIKTIK